MKKMKLKYLQIFQLKIYQINFCNWNMKFMITSQYIQLNTIYNIFNNSNNLNKLSENIQ